VADFPGWLLLKRSRQTKKICWCIRHKADAADTKYKKYRLWCANRKGWRMHEAVRHTEVWRMRMRHCIPMADTNYDAPLESMAERKHKFGAII